MPEFIQGKGAPKKAPDLIEVDIDSACEKCFAPADKVYYNKVNKTLIVICPSEHETILQGNWGWIING